MVREKQQPRRLPSWMSTKAAERIEQRISDLRVVGESKRKWDISAAVVAWQV